MEKNQLKHQLKIVLLFSLLFMVSMPALVWGQPIQQITINYIEATTVPDEFFNQVRAFVTVSDANESPILGLSADNFRALEDGRKITIEEVSKADDPMTVVLAIDTSGSMQARDKSGQTSMAAAKRAALDFISLLAEDDQVALFSFNTEPKLQVDFSEDHGAAINAIYALSAKPNAATCLYDTAYEAVKKAAEIPKGRRAIILLTDGKDEKAGGTCSTYSSNDVIDAATTKTIRVPIYTIGVGPKVDARELGRIASLTGGRNLLATSLAELTGFYQTIANQLKNQYLVTYFTKAPSGEHSLVLKVKHEESQGQDEKRFWTPPLPVLRPPTISFISPSSEDKIRGTVIVKISISPEDAVTKVRFYVDAVLKKEHMKAPFDTFEWDTTGLSSGLHVIRVEAIDINGQSGYAEMTRSVIAPHAASKQKPTPLTKGGGEGIPTIVWLAGLLLLLIFIAGMVVLMVRKRHKDEPMQDIEDETMFIRDAEDIKVDIPSWLKVIESSELDPGQTFQIKGNAIIGRSSENDIHIPDKSVSRRHAEIYFENDVCYIRDLGSKNGVKVDGKRIPSEGFSLSSGAQIRLGPKTILEFNILDLDLGSKLDDKTRKYGD